MSINVGDTVPNISFTTMTAEGPGPIGYDDLFAGKRVSASVNKGQELPQDFGQASSIVEHGMIDGAFNSRMEIREKITNLIRVLLKKSEIEAQAESTSNVKVDLQSAS